jgi:hypothetical protein
MSSVSGTCLALGVAAVFAAACDQDDKAAASGAGRDTAPTAAAVEKAAATDESGMPKGQEGEVHCLGIHECKGQSECHIAGGHACAGMNDCKGKGWINVSRSECAAKGGKVVDG